VEGNGCFHAGTGVWDFTLGEKDHVGTHHLFPLRRLHMSSNVKKYIGLDVHKEAIAIAVLNDAGKW
jgi:hypothetical protein